MNFEEFEKAARLYVVGALDAEEITAFTEGRRQFGAKAEDFINECRKLNSIFALSLQPRTPKSDTKAKLMSLIEKLKKGERATFNPKDGLGA